MDTLTNAAVIAAADELRRRWGAIGHHGVRWRPAAWRRALPKESWATDTLDRLESWGDELIRRKHVAEFASDPLPLFVASSVWGYGPVGYGPSRVAAIIAAEGTQLAMKLTGIVAASQLGPAEAWDAITDQRRIHRFGVAFGTKFAYFASLSDDALDPRPLIADINTSWALWSVARIPRSIELRQSYLDYVKYAHHPDFDGYAPDEIEWALFSLGPSARRAARQSGCS